MAAGTSDTLSETINDLFAKEKWSSARRLLERELAKIPGDDLIRHWFLTRISTTLYEERKYAKALQYAKEAQLIVPGCPLVLWDLAGSYSMLGDYASAMVLYEELIDRGVTSIANDECGEGRVWARSLIADSWYRLGLASANLGQPGQAIKAFCTHLDLRAKGYESIYDLRDVIGDLLKVKRATKVELAEFMGIPEELLRSILTGASSPTVAHLRKISRFFRSIGQVNGKIAGMSAKRRA